MEKFLKEIGFKHMTGPLWKHEEFGIMSFEKEETKQIIVARIYNRGWNECQAMIIGSLGIKPIN